ncbi:cbb3-type cytochrome oxidase assembly protein CcoS [Dokdonella sp.]|uniref:cbb3-type cytochrome oxidase assembly protein CcoS n=1 Tax=Dokdonella sp. TaxID=2291710 RepID=UPI00260C4DFE|nr:cbb3-type cytochrome oxidase assembly protein CcoS [Dokdonella sp.]
MNIILFLIPLSAVLVVLGGFAFFWAVDNDQFDDLDTPALMPLAGDPGAPPVGAEDGTDAAAARRAD